MLHPHWNILIRLTNRKRLPFATFPHLGKAQNNAPECVAGHFPLSLVTCDGDEKPNIRTSAIQTGRKAGARSTICANTSHEGSPHPSRLAPCHLPRWGRLSGAALSLTERLLPLYFQQESGKRKFTSLSAKVRPCACLPQRGRWRTVTACGS